MNLFISKKEQRLNFRKTLLMAKAEKRQEGLPKENVLPPTGELTKDRLDTCLPKQDAGTASSMD